LEKKEKEGNLKLQQFGLQRMKWSNLKWALGAKIEKRRKG
jgi:hypothetical protein